MKLFLIVITVLLSIDDSLAAQLPSEADTNSKVPSFAATILESQFPELKGKDLADVGKHLQALEFFREFVLEKYNKGVTNYLSKLKDADIKLEKRRRDQAVTPSDYEKLHEHLKDEYEKCSAKGEYLNLYMQYLAKYKSETKLALAAKKRLERERLRL